MKNTLKHIKWMLWAIFLLLASIGLKVALIGYNRPAFLSFLIWAFHVCGVLVAGCSLFVSTLVDEDKNEDKK